VTDQLTRIRCVRVTNCRQRHITSPREPLLDVPRALPVPHKHHRVCAPCREEELDVAPRCVKPWRSLSLCGEPAHFLSSRKDNNDARMCHLDGRTFGNMSVHLGAGIANRLNPK